MSRKSSWTYAYHAGFDCDSIDFVSCLSSLVDVLDSVKLVFLEQVVLT